MRVLCYGDSNTYGCDPRSQLGGRYPIQVRWTGRLTEQGYQVENWGLNGREIPTRPREWEAVESLIARESSGDRVVVMLGTNDLLQPGLTARDVAARMEDFLARPGMRRLPVLLVAPPPMVRGGVGNGGPALNSVRLAGRGIPSSGPAAGRGLCRRRRLGHSAAV